MSFSYHRADPEIKDFIIFNIHEGNRRYGIQIADELVREAMKNTDSFCRVVDTMLQRLAHEIVKDLK